MPTGLRRNLLSMKKNIMTHGNAAVLSFENEMASEREERTDNAYLPAVE